MDQKTLKRRLQHLRVWDAKHLILVLCAVLLIFLIAYPLSLLAVKSLPFSNYIYQIKSSQTLTAFKNTLYVAFGSTAVALVLGIPLAFLTIRTDIPLKKVIHAGILLIFYTPGYIGTIAWIQLFGRSGYITRWMKQHQWPLYTSIDIYTLEGVIFFMGLYLMPLVYIAAANALQKTDPNLEDAAIMSGASPFKAFVDSTLPMTLPAILSNTLLVLIHGFSGFGIPAALGMPTGNLVLTTLIYAALGHYDVNMACAISVILVLLISITIVIQNRLQQKRRYDKTVSTQTPNHIFSLGRWKFIITTIILLFIICVSVIPLITIFLSSMLKSWGLAIAFNNFTVSNYHSIFTAGIGIRALRNSFTFAFISATCATIIGFFIAYISYRTKLPGRKFLDSLATIPSAVPGPVLAAAMIFTWMLPPFALYNTPWIIIIAYIVAFLPYSLRNIVGGLNASNPQLEEMGQMCGGSWMKVLRDIVIPNIRGSIWSGWIIAFLMAFRELPLSSMLYANGTETVGVLIFLLKTESGGLEVTSAVAIVVMLLTILGQISVKHIAKSVTLFQSG